MLFFLLFVCIAVVFYLCSCSKTFLQSDLGRFLFVTYYQFDFDNTTCYTSSYPAQETAARFWADAQFGVIVKKLDNPKECEFHPVALHQGSLNANSIKYPLVSFAQFVHRTTTNPEEASEIILKRMRDMHIHNSVQRDMVQFLKDGSIVELEQPSKRFTESFIELFHVLQQDPNARVSFHVFEMGHVFEITRLLASHPKKCFAAQFPNPNDNPFYVAIELDNAQQDSLSFIKTPLKRVRYVDIANYGTQEHIFTQQHKSNAIHIIREDKERFEAMGQKSYWGKHGLSMFTFLTLFKVVRTVVFDDQRCWNVNCLSKFVHVNPFCATSRNWMTIHAQPYSVLFTLGFWNIVFWTSYLCWLCVFTFPSFLFAYF